MIVFFFRLRVFVFLCIIMLSSSAYAFSFRMHVTFFCFIYINDVIRLHDFFSFAGTRIFVCMYRCFSSCMLVSFHIHTCCFFRLHDILLSACVFVLYVDTLSIVFMSLFFSYAYISFFVCPKVVFVHL